MKPNNKQIDKQSPGELVRFGPSALLAMRGQSWFRINDALDPAGVVYDPERLRGIFGLSETPRYMARGGYAKMGSTCLVSQLNHHLQGGTIQQFYFDDAVDSRGLVEFGPRDTSSMIALPTAMVQLPSVEAVEKTAQGLLSAHFGVNEPASYVQTQHDPTTGILLSASFSTSPVHPQLSADRKTLTIAGRPYTLDADLHFAMQIASGWMLTLREYHKRNLVYVDNSGDRWDIPACELPCFDGYGEDAQGRGWLYASMKSCRLQVDLETRRIGPPESWK